MSSSAFGGPDPSPGGTLTGVRRRLAPAFQWAPGRPAIAEGVRAALIVVLPLVAAFRVDLPALTWISLGGWLAALGDRGGAYRTRAARFVAFGAMAAVAVTLAAAAGRGAVSAVLAMLAWGIGASLLRAYPSAVGAVAGPVTILFGVAVGIPAASTADALQRGLFTGAGALLAMVLALGVFPFRYYRPARRAVARCYERLADRLETIAAQARDRAPVDVWLTGLQRDHPPLRETLEDARAVIGATRHGREAESERGERLLVLTETADQLFATLVTLAAELEASAIAGPVDASCLSRLDDMADHCRAIAAQVEGDGAGRARRRAPARPARPGASPLDAVLARLALFLAAADESVTGLDASSGTATVAWFLPRLARPSGHGWLRPLRDQLSWRSVTLRHALRVGIVGAVTLAVGRALALEHAYWATLVALLVIQPYAGATTIKGVQRVAGTIVGALLAAALAGVMHQPVVAVIILFVLAGAAVALFPLNYAAYALLSTPVFVLLAELRAGSWHLASVRIANTVLGAAIALLGSAVLWPSAERTRAPAALADAIGAVRDYARHVLGGAQGVSADASVSGGPASVDTLTDARRAVSLALLNADASLQRLLTEEPPGRGTTEALMAVLAYARRLATSLTALAVLGEAATHRRAAIDSGVPAARLGAVAVALLDDLASSLASSGVPAPMPELEELVARLEDDAAGPGEASAGARVARQLIILHEVVARAVGQAAAGAGVVRAA